MLTYPNAFGGLVCLSGMNALKVPDWKNIPDIDAKKKMPVFMYHGESDDMIKHTIAKQTYQEFLD